MINVEDADIDALMNSVVGNNGEIVPFPATIEARARVKKIKATAAVEELSGELAAEIEANTTPPPVIDPRTIPVRFSRLRQMAASALHYWSAVQDDRPDTIAMRFGRGVHALVLGTPVIRWTGKTRQGKAWEAFKAKHADKEILSTKEWDRAHGLYEAIKRHPLANDAIFAGEAVLEEQIEWQFMGRACTSRPDSRYGVERLVDLKTTRCAEPRKFERDAMWRGYHGQMDFYRHAIRDRFGAFPRESLVVAVEPIKPFAITVMRLTPNALQHGEKVWRGWFESLLVCEAANVWPAYTDALADLDVVGTDDVNLVIDGEEFSFEDAT